MSRLRRAAGLFLVFFALASCEGTPPSPPSPTPLLSRYSRIPEDAVKIHPEDDLFPPILHNSAWELPQPMAGPINSSGGEDSPFITTDGSTLFFFFTPDVNLQAEKQLTEGVTGIYQSRLQAGGWGEPERLVLSDGLALDGCPMLHGNELWFCTVREGLNGLHWFKASYQFGVWGDWELADFDPDYQVGELHITGDGQELYFHSARPGSLGENDIWVSQLENGSWGEPSNLTAVNSPEDDSRPFVSSDGQQLWFTRTYQGSPAVFLSRRENGAWGEPELIVSQFAGEPTLDDQGNLYFVHHFFRDGVMLEADIYLAKKK